MKRLLWIPLLFLCSTLWAAEPVQIARMNVGIVGGSVAAGGPASCDCSSGCTWIGYQTAPAYDLDTYGGHVPSAAHDSPAFETPAGGPWQVCEISAYVKYTSTATYRIRVALYDNGVVEDSYTGPYLLADTANVTVDNAAYAWRGGMSSTQINGGTAVNLEASTFYRVFVWFENNDTKIGWSTSATDFYNDVLTGKDYSSSGHPAQQAGVGAQSAGVYNMRVGFK